MPMALAAVCTWHVEKLLSYMSILFLVCNYLCDYVCCH
uniref:Uncharacterized protein n=1 Tax=Arundo donax TaxID=35708 RepID=A0A0A9F1Y8_ARUDO